MKLVEVYDMARNNIKGRKKIGWILGSIFFLSILIFMIVNSIADSLNLAVKQIKETPLGRTTIYKDWEGDGRIYEELRDVCEELKHVTEVYPYVRGIGIELMVPDGDFYMDMNLEAVAQCYEDYMVKGELPEQGEILLPEYFDITRDGGYERSSGYIGEKVTFVVSDRLGEKSILEYTVSGTYDNFIAISGDYVAFVSQEDALAIYETSMKGWEDELKAVMEAEGSSSTTLYAGFEPEYHYAVVVDSRKNLEEVKQDIYQSLELSGHENVQFYDEEDTTDVFSIIRFIGNGIAALLLVVVLVMMVIMIGNDIRSRRKEMAMYQVYGYRGKELLHILGMEYTVRFVPLAVAAALVTAGLMILINLVIRNMLPMEFQMIHMKLTVTTLCFGALIVVSVLGIAVRVIYGQLKKVVLLKEIKSEG